MCTVTYIKTKNKVIITSNRDENSKRPLADEPQEEIINNCRIYYPKDPKAGGTWFAVNEFGAVVVLLNGAFHNHKKIGPYSKSRGLVVLDSASSPDPFQKIKLLPLQGIEPFTMVLYQSHRLLEVRWDGKRKYLRDLYPESPYIWSSSTLYKPSVINRRKMLFSKFLNSCSNPDENEVLRFQSDSHKDPENGFVMNRNTGLRTLSISQAVCEGNDLVLKYIDLERKVSHQIPVPVKVNPRMDHEPSRA